MKFWQSCFIPSSWQGDAGSTAQPTLTPRGPFPTGAPDPSTLSPASSVVFNLLDVYFSIQLEGALGARPTALPRGPILLLPTTLIGLLTGQVIPARPTLLAPCAWLWHWGAGGGPARHHLRGVGSCGPWLGGGEPLSVVLCRVAKAAKAVEGLAVLWKEGERGAKMGAGCKGSTKTTLWLSVVRSLGVLCSFQKANLCAVSKAFV